MMNQHFMSITLLTLHLLIPGCSSLKEKRSLVRPLLARLHRQFNISVAEIGLQDRWQESIVACTVVSNDANHNQRVMQEVVSFTEDNFPNLQIIDEKIEII